MNNPLIAANAASTIAKTESGQKAMSDLTTALRIAFLIGGAVLTIKIGSSYYKKLRAKKYIRENAAKPEVQAALMLYNAMFSNMIEVLGFQVPLPDGTDEDTLNKLALSCNLKEVVKSYNILFNRALLFDVQQELTSKELQTFFKRLSAKGRDNKVEISSIKPFLVDETVYVRNKNGVVLKKITKENDKYVVSNTSKGDYDYGDELGTIAVVIKKPGGVFYAIDRNLRFDNWYTGYGLVDHRDVINKNPDKL